VARDPSVPLSIYAPHSQGSHGAGRGRPPWRWRLPARLPRTAPALAKLLAALVAAVVVFHAASCGVFFCYRFPASMELQFPSTASAYDDIRDMYRLGGGPRGGGGGGVATTAAAASRGLVADGDSTPSSAGDADEKPLPPLRIPRVIHQTYKSAKVPEAVRPFMHSWRSANPGWAVQFYDDEACIQFVSREFPGYLQAYRQLLKDVERSDFFRHACCGGQCSLHLPLARQYTALPHCDRSLGYKSCPPCACFALCMRLSQQHGSTIYDVAHPAITSWSNPFIGASMGCAGTW